MWFKKGVGRAKAMSQKKGTRVIVNSDSLGSWGGMKYALQDLEYGLYQINLFFFF